MRTPEFWLSLLFPMVIASGCSAIFRPAHPPWPALPDGYFMHVGDFLQITGTGAVGSKEESETLRKSVGRDAALVEAWRRLGDYLRKLPVVPEGTFGARIDKYPVIRQRFKAFVNEASIVSTQWEDGLAIVVLRINKGDFNRKFRLDFK